VRGIGLHYLADHHPVEEHPQRRQAQLHRRPRMDQQLALDEGSNVHRLHLAGIRNAQLDAEVGELAHRLHVGAPRVAVSDMRAKKIT
jgi:hypothetical protein